jgi:DNA replication protein DnaC
MPNNFDIEKDTLTLDTKIHDIICRTVPKIFRHASLSDFKNIKINIRKPFYLSGDVGCGKTRLAWAIVCDVIRFSVKKYHRVVSMPEVISWVDTCIQFRNCSFQKRERIIGKYTSKENKNPLIIDDLGAESKTGMTLTDDLLYIILNHRYENSLITCFTSNFKTAELPYQDPRILSRIVGITKGNAHHFTETEDRRIKKT